MAEMSIWKPKDNILFSAAKNKVSSLRTAFEQGVKPELQKNKFLKIIEGDPNSPLIMGLGENKHLIYYPKNSTPYLHQYETSIKFIEILSGRIKDLISGKEYKTGDKIKIYPGENIQPATFDYECYVRVCVSKVDSIWERVCD